MGARAISVVLLALLGAACSGSEALPDDEARALLENRNWLDRWPTAEDERLHVYRFTPSMGGGVYQDRTLFAGRFELFNYQLTPAVIRITWPDRGKTEALAYRIESVDGPRPFDLRLVLDGPALGPRVFYGIRSEGPGTTVEALLSAQASR